MSQKVAFAVRCSLAVLLALEDGEPSEETVPPCPSLPLVGSLYLWTFTFPDVTTLEEASRRWTLFNNRLRNLHLNVRWMRFLEPHAIHGWHVHTVAAQFYPVETIRKLALKFGFGRMHVKQIPAHAAGYVLKYVTKYKRASSDGKFRLWACNGFKGVPVSQVRIYDSHLDFCLSQIGFSEASKYSIDFIYRNGLECWAKQTHIGDAKIQKTMNENQKKSALAVLELGGKIVFAEYRGTKLREARKYIEGRASLSEKSYYASHLYEANSAPLLVEEVLPDSFRPSDTLVSPLKKGQTCILELTSVKVFNGKETYAAKIHAPA